MVSMGPDSDSWYRQVVESLPQLVWTCDASGACAYASKRMLDFIGVSLEDMQGDRWLEQVHADDRAGALAAWRHAVEAESEYRTEYRLKRHDGAYRWFEARATPLRDADGRVVRWFGANTEIHEQREMREALHEERLRLATIAAASPQLLHSVNASPTGRVTFPYVSPAFVRLFGISAEQLAVDAAPLLALYHHDDAEGVRISVGESAQNLTPWKHQWRINTPTRGEIWVECHSMPVPQSDGSMTWHGTLSEITERRRNEERIKNLNSELEARVRARTAELERANRELEAFSYSVSHDLREPLRAMNGFSQALDEDFGDSLPPEARGYLGSVRRAAVRMGQLIDDLLSFSRLARQALKRRPVNTLQLVKECLQEVEPNTAQTREIVVGELPDCEADPALLRQVFLNLLSNAFKYSRGKSPARIEVGALREANGDTVYFVRDNGSGFDMQHASKLFGVFQRLHRQDEFEGTGVGLAIVHRIVSRHGGRVWAEAASNQGATFSFTLPVASGQEEAAQ